MFINEVIINPNINLALNQFKEIRDLLNADFVFAQKTFIIKITISIMNATAMPAVNENLRNTKPQRKECRSIGLTSRQDRIKSGKPHL